MTRRIHQVCASAISDEAESTNFATWEARAAKLTVYARRLGFSVMYENVDQAEPGDLLTRLGEGEQK